MRQREYKAPTYLLRDDIITRRKFDALVARHGFQIHALSDTAQNLHVTYYPPRNWGYDNRFYHFHIYYRKFGNLPELTGCVVSLGTLVKNRHGKSESRKFEFYMDNLKSAYEMLFGLFFSPEKVRFMQVVGKKRVNLTEKEFLQTGSKEREFIFLMKFPLNMLTYLFRLCIAPIRAIIRHYPKWEYLYEHMKDEFVLIRRYCRGRYNRRSVMHNWMVNDPNWLL